MIIHSTYLSITCWNLEMLISIHFSTAKLSGLACTETYRQLQSDNNARNGQRAGKRNLVHNMFPQWFSRQTVEIPEVGLEKMKEDRFQIEDQPVHFGFRWRLRKLLAHTIEENKQQGKFKVYRILIYSFSSSFSWLPLQPEKGMKLLLV